MSNYGEIWKVLSTVNCNKHVQQKGGLSYLSWAWAWGTLMQYYPQATFEFLPEKTFEGGTVEVICTVKIDECERKMTLPVMDYKNKAIPAPDARDISDNRMRCLVKCLALYGLGFYLYAGEDIGGIQASQATVAKQNHDAAVAANLGSVNAIIEGLANDDMSAAAEAWFELDEETQRALWLAPSRGGCFSTKDRATMKLPEFKLAYTGHGA